MGYFDTLYDPRLKCPHCGGSDPLNRMEIQTKGVAKSPEGHMYSVHYAKGCDCTGIFQPYPHAAPEPPRAAHVEGWAVCKSAICCAYARLWNFVHMGRVGITNRSFRVLYPVRKGVLSGPGRVFPEPKERESFAELLRGLHEVLAAFPKAKESFQKPLKFAGGDPGLAIQVWSYNIPFEKFQKFDWKRSKRKAKKGRKRR